MTRTLAILLTLLTGVAFADAEVAPVWFPQVKRLARPDWIRPGMRITYYNVSTTLVLRDATKSEVSRGGSPKQLERSTGVGFVQVDVVAVAGNTVGVNVRFFLLSDGEEGSAAKLMSEAGDIGPGASAGDFWIHPKALAATKPTNPADNPEPKKDAPPGTPGDAKVSILRVIHTANGKEYSATRFNLTAKLAKYAYVWDNRSGVLLHKSSDKETPDHKLMGLLEYRSARQLKLPWAGSPMPGWLKTVKRMEFVGTLKRSDPGGVAVKLPYAMRYDFLGHGPNWTRIKVASVAGTLSDLDGRAKPVGVRVCAGPGMIGGPWIPPTGLTNLTAGQVLDRDRHTRLVTTVAHAGMHNGRNVVLIVEENDKQRIEYHYDARSGGLLRLRVRDSEHHAETFLRLKSTK